GGRRIITKFLTDLNTRIGAKREADLQTYIAPRLDELKAVDPVLKELGLAPVVRQYDDLIFVTFEDPTNEKMSAIHLEFDGKRRTRSATAQWSRARMEINVANVLQVSDNGWTFYENPYADIRPLESYSVQDVVDQLTSYLPTNPVLLKDGGPNHTENDALAILYEDVKAVLNEIGGGPVIAERRPDDVHGSVEMLVFTDAEGRKYHLEFFDSEEGVLREDGSVHPGGSMEDRAELKGKRRLRPIG
ncbi:hypothetical protein, partial [Shinella sp.]|uniref:hypothetical protein n=1 Tax=Shinella sp. TaxID=1870904 RepID=UPI002898C187